MKEASLNLGLSQNFRTANDTSFLPVSAAMYLLQQYTMRAAKSVINAHVVSQNIVCSDRKGFPPTASNITQLELKQCRTRSNNTNKDDQVEQLKRKDWCLTILARPFGTRKVRCLSPCDEILPASLFRKEFRTLILEAHRP